MAKEWYILHTFSGREARVERAVRMLVEHARIPTNVIFDIKIPEELLTEVKDGKKRVVRRKFFPGYLLVEMDLPEVDWRIVCNEVRRIPGVSGFWVLRAMRSLRRFLRMKLGVFCRRRGKLRGIGLLVSLRLFWLDNR